MRHGHGPNLPVEYIKVPRHPCAHFLTPEHTDHLYVEQQSTANGFKLLANCFKALYSSTLFITAFSCPWIHAPISCFSP